MCQARSEGGIRCHAHAVAALKRAQDALNENKDPSKYPELQAAVTKAQFDYNLTKEGISDLRAEGNDQDAQYFQDAREQILAASKLKRERLRDKENDRLRGKLKDLYTQEGVEELRVVHDNDALADRIQAHLERRRLAQHDGGTGLVVNKLPVDKPFRPVRPPSLIGVIGKGAIQGGIQGFKSGHGVKSGFAAGSAVAAGAKQKHASAVKAQEIEKQKEDAQVSRDASLKEKQQLAQEREDAKLEADSLRWLRQQEKQEARFMAEAEREERKTQRKKAKV